MKRIELELRGTTPLLMHSNVGVNPLHPLTLAKKAISGKRNKTEEDTIALFEIDWELGLYWNDEVGVYVPAQNIEATFRNAAKKIKKGSAVKEGLFVFPDFVKLLYPGPQTKEELKSDQRYRDIRVGVVQRASIMVCRPRFDRWSLDVTLEYDPLIFDEETIIQIAETAGRYIGLCDYRPRYGKFEVIRK